MKNRRPYRMKERAKSQEETRQKIVEAAMHLHEEIGPLATTISAIADRAGVQRLTVYRHFSDETAVFQACTSHWLELNPLPDPQAWSEITDPARRLEAALSAFYAYYGSTREMWTGAYRDVEQVPALKRPMEEIESYMAAVSEDLAAVFKADASAAPEIGATVGHALAFSTWTDLDDRGLDDKAKVALVRSWMAALVS